MQLSGRDGSFQKVPKAWVKKTAVTGCTWLFFIKDSLAMRKMHVGLGYIFSVLVRVYVHGGCRYRHTIDL